MRKPEDEWPFSWPPTPLSVVLIMVKIATDKFETHISTGSHQIFAKLRSNIMI